jgi:hypothetical protein
VAADLLDRAQVDPGFDFSAAEAARQQQAQQAGVVQLRQQRFADALGLLDCCGGGLDHRAEVAGAGDRVGGGDMVHAAAHGGQ